MNNWGYALEQAGQLVKAKDKLKSALVMDDKLGDAHFNLGNVQTKLRWVFCLFFLSRSRSLKLKLKL